VGKVKKFFKIEERGTSVRQEVIGGLVTFLAMAYILALNPGILGDTDALGAAAFPAGGVFVATAIAAGVATLLMGLFANYPIALAPGMGINAFIAYTVIAPWGNGYTWQEALAAVFISGIIFLVISLTPIRKWIINAVPNGLKKAIGAGIGFFIAFIGLQNAGIIVPDSATAVSLGDLSDPSVLLAVFGIVVALAFFVMKGKVSKFALILSMAVTAVVGIVVTYVFSLTGNAGMPTFGEFNYSSLSEFKDTFFGFAKGFKTVFSHTDLWFVLFSLIYLDIFDTAGTLIAVSEPAGLLDEEGNLKDVDKAMLTDAIGTTIGAMVGTSTVTSFVESSAGIEAGARTGLSSVVVGVLFLVSIVAFPIFNIFIGSFALTSMALVLVGILMFSQIKNIDFSDLPTLGAAFIIIVMMVLTYSIGMGIAFGFIAYVLMMMVQKRFKEVNPVMYVLAVAFIAYFAVETLF
jgi:AGZA family xanthine/uracil permease-like MFS transporter